MASGERSVEAYDRMRVLLAGALGELSDSANTVAAATEQLAGPSSQARRAVHEIAAAVGDVAQGAETGRVVGAVADAAKRTEDGVQTVRHAREAIGSAIEDVSLRVGEIADAVAHISRNAERAAHDVEEVAGVAEESSASAEQVSASTQETSASTQEIAASAESRASTANGLRGVVPRFTVR